MLSFTIQSTHLLTPQPTKKGRTSEKDFFPHLSEHNFTTVTLTLQCRQMFVFLKAELMNVPQLPF